MSHSPGEVLVDGKVVAYFEYNGTADVAISKIYPNEWKRNNKWRTNGDERWLLCTCEDESCRVKCVLQTLPLTWNSEICLFCMVITGDHSSYMGDW